MWSKGKAKSKRNMLRYYALKPYDSRRRRPLFISTGTGFDVDFLEYHLNLMFRCGAGWKGAAFASAMVYPFGVHERWWRRALSMAMKYLLCIKELDPLGMHSNIFIGEIGKVNLDAYRKHVQDTLFKKASSNSHTAVMDGHSKARLLTRKSEMTLKQGGRAIRWRIPKLLLFEHPFHHELVLTRQHRIHLGT